MDRRAHVVRWTVVSGLAVVIGTLATMAGPLDPPAGPVTPTGKTLTEVEPRIAVNAANTPGTGTSIFRITQPGSYYLTGNITGVAGRNGVEIAATGVTLDLNGFDLAGVAGSLDGVILTTSSSQGVTVLNGTVRNWGGDGVSLTASNAQNGRVAAVRAGSNGGHGINVGFNCAVTGCAAYFNGGNGFGAQQGCTISQCGAYQNTGDGFNASSGSTVSACRASFSGGNGISVNVGCLVTGCTALANDLDGIRCSAGATISHNNCRQNGDGAGDGAGIHATSTNNRIEDNNCTLADRGIDVDVAGNIIIRNTCADNTIDWVIAASNVFGPIIDRRVPANAAVSGFVAPSSLGSTDANANFSY